MKILIWGTGKIATRYLKYGYFSGYQIVGFIDTNSTEGKFQGYVVNKPDKINAVKYDYIIVCVKNSNEEILKECIRLDFNISKIVFVNYYAGFGNIDDKYVKLLPIGDTIKKLFPNIYIQIEEYRAQHEYMYKNIARNSFNDVAFIKKIGVSHVVAWIPVELLFFERTADVVQDDYTESWEECHSEWQDLPVICSRPYRNLFEFFLTGKTLPYVYYKWWIAMHTARGESISITCQELIEKRFREFQIMQRNMNRGMDFFIEHPAMAKWNIKGYFNLWDGHHRVAFLYHSGVKRIPICVTKEDYEKWLNTDKARKVYDLINKQNRFEFYQPILNPYFVDIRSYREDFTKSRLHHILEYFGNRRFAGKKVIDIGACLGYFGQMFARLGAAVTMIEYDPVHYELLCELNKLMRVSCKNIKLPFECFDTDERFDIAIMLTVFYPYLKDGKVKKEFLNRLDKYVSTALIWESGDEIEMEKDVIIQNTKFKYFKHLCYTFGTGKIRELGVFFADEHEMCITNIGEIENYNT